MQIIACYFYVGSLILAAVFWGISGVNGHANPVPILPELTKTLLGVLVGALTVGLR
ncbi:MAG TPA: hypothetical protein VF540_03365 [Segetibacter sp.]